MSLDGHNKKLDERILKKKRKELVKDLKKIVAEELRQETIGKIKDIVDRWIYKNPRFDSRNDYSIAIACDIYDQVILVKKIRIKRPT